MSSHLYTPAYATRLGNLTAKSVLVCICEEANDDGVGWPSVARIVKKTEIARRTVQRVLEVFATIGLVELKEMEISDRFGRRTVDAVVVNVAMLGRELSEKFAAAFAAAQGKASVPGRNGRLCLRDASHESETRVSETQKDVSETHKCVSETLPLEPLFGRPSIDPVVDPPAENARGDDGLNAEQQEHLDRLAAEGKPLEPWRGYYLEENRKAAEAREAALAEQARDEELRREYPDLETAISRMRKKCGFAWSKGDELGAVLLQVFLDQREMGKPVWRTAAQMVAAWALQREQGLRLRARYGPMAFFRDGHWLDSAGWHWNTELLERERGARVGS